MLSLHIYCSFKKDLYTVPHLIVNVYIELGLESLNYFRYTASKKYFPLLPLSIGLGVHISV